MCGGNVLRAGRASVDVFIPQQRRARPGWDGCRDRWDKRDKRIPRDYYSMPNEMVCGCVCE